MNGLLLVAQGSDACSLSIGGKPELCREIELLHRCGCKEVFVLLLKADDNEAKLLGKKLAAQYPFLNVGATPDAVGCETIAALLATSPREPLLTMQCGTVLQEDEIQMFAQYASELVPDNYIGITHSPQAEEAADSDSPILLCKDLMRVDRIPESSEKEMLPPNENRVASFAGIGCFTAEVLPELRRQFLALPTQKAEPDNALLFILQQAVKQGEATFAAYPFSQALHLKKKTQTPYAEQLLKAPFPLLLLASEGPEESSQSLQPLHPNSSTYELFDKVAYELRSRNYPCICMSEAHFADLAFFFPFCFYAGTNDEIQDILDIFSEEGCHVATPADLQLGNYLPTAKTPEEAIAKALIDCCKQATTNATHSAHTPS